MLSILIPIYNYDVTALIEALLPQAEASGIPFEIILLDDCSSSKKTVTQNQKINSWENCFYFSNEENKGRTFTRNLLAQKAQFPWLLFLDADVLPRSTDFIKNFNLTSALVDVIFGGISYDQNPPEKPKMLRWKYGKAREAKPTEERKKKPYISLISQSCLIKKTIFLKANCYLDNSYGVDVLFARNLENLNAKIQHIDNPVIHNGLENSRTFIEKTKKGLETLAYFSTKEMIPDNYRPIQKAYLQLKKYRLAGLFIFFIGNLSPFILNNLTNKNPSLLLFDLYRLYYYADLNN